MRAQPDSQVMHFEMEDRGEYSLVRCAGVMDSGMRPYASEILHPLIEAGKFRLLIDLSGVNRITSEGIGLLVTLVARANAKGSRVVFVCPSAFVQAVFEATKIDRFLETEANFDEGVKRLLKQRTDE